MSLKLPTDFRGLTRLFKKYGVKLNRGGVTADYPNCCVLSALGVINSITYTHMVELNDIKLASIEIGFEGWPTEDFFDSEYDMKYVEIGRKLYEWSLSQKVKKGA
jgi:hypothetical protein